MHVQILLRPPFSRCGHTAQLQAPTRPHPPPACRRSIDGEYALDILYREVPAELLKAQLDTCWVNVGGEVPADYIRKYAGRVPVIHLKDFVGQKSANMYALIGIDDGEAKKVDETQAFCLRPVGSGKQDFPAILKACEESGTKWVVVEQDNPSMDLTPIECAKSSIDYLKSL